MVLGHFLDNHLKYVDETWSEVRQNGREAVAKDCISILSTIEVIFRVKDGRNRPNLMNDPTFFSENEIFLIKFLIVPTQEVIILKVKIEDLQNLVPLSRYSRIIQ